MKVDDPNPTSPAASNDALAALIRTAGRRESPPVQVYERTLLVATQAWRRKVRRRQYTTAVAIAASALVALALSWHVTTRDAAKPVARLDRIMGPVEMQSAGSEWAAVDDNTRVLHEGASIRTGPSSRVGLLLGNGHSLRLAEATEVRMVAKSRVELIAGKAYVGTLDIASRPVEVVTRAGTATDIGTQFEVQYRDDRYRLRVREGAVMLQREAQLFRSAAGEQLSIDADGELRRAAMNASDADWNWVEALAPTLAVDGRPLTVLLNWVARETGRAVRYADIATQRRAETTILHGAIGDLAPLQALSLMLETTNLRHRLLEDGTIMIEAR